MLPVSDAVQVSAQCAGVVMVGRLRATTLAGLKRALATLTRARVNVLGVVLVGSDEDPDSGYGYSYGVADRRDGSGRERREAARDPSHTAGGRRRRRADEGG